MAEGSLNRLMKYLLAHQGTKVLVSDHMFEALSKYKWYITPHGYVRRATSKNGRTVNMFMHRQIMNALPGSIVDHINRNKLDNRLENLRFVTHGENRINSKLNSNNKSGYRNIHRHHYKDLWILAYKRNNKRIRIYRKDLNELLAIREKRRQDVAINY